MSEYQKDIRQAALTHPYFDKANITEISTYYGVSEEIVTEDIKQWRNTHD